MIEAVPKLTPVTWGWVAGWVCPAGTTTLVGAIVTLLASLLAKVTVVSAAAALGKVTGNGADCPGARVTPLGSPMPPAL